MKNKLGAKDHTKVMKDIFEIAGKLRDGSLLNYLDALTIKDVPTKPELISDGDYDGEPVYDMWQCPNCGKLYEIDYDVYDYCPNCGQHIDRSEMDD